MSSNMTDVNEGFIQFPVPGVDNNSQGFRDRYSIIRANLNTAKSEITDLQESTAKVNENSNFKGNKIIDANLSQTTIEINRSEETNPLEGDSLIVSWLNGQIQVFTIDNDSGNGNNEIEIDFVDWPEEPDRFSKMTLIIKSTEDILGSGKSLIWPEDAKFNFSDPIEISSAANEPVKIFEIFTYDGGDNLFIDYKGEYVSNTP